ncbi:OprD family outer membrane porin [Roseimicrobium sp. ORNL1]|uniref:OprD family outer membrane porin n=1 Tax=Roseimicrobium sp. ORNL1 TaxID=2711231 RepID=UPI0013E1F592|nr:OprD family outer membrane porin [Roseimicrobium sp. ORNL1]QIF01896.1 OprD family porin [Roseimicrobium sp. ORNL1]
MKLHRRFWGVVVVVAALVGHAKAQDYLLDYGPPPDRVSELPTPFTPFEEPVERGRLGTFSSEPFIRDAVFSLDPRFYYRYLRNSRGSSDVLAGGGTMGLTTGEWLGVVQFGVVGYTTQPLTDLDGADPTGLVGTDGEGFTTLGEAWAKLSYKTVTATLFRQRLDLPFINGNDSRMLPNTFEAYQVEAELTEGVRVNAGYVAKMRARNSPDFIRMSDAAGAPEVSRGVTFVSLLLGSEDKTYFDANTQVTRDLFMSTYIQTGHTWQLNPEVELRGDLQFADQRSVGDDLIGDFDTQFYGARLAASYRGAVLSFMATSTGSRSGIVDPYGVDPGFNGMMLSGFALRDERSVGTSLSYDFAKVGLEGLTAWAHYAYGRLPSDNHEQEINVTVDYRITEGYLKNFWLRVRYAHLDEKRGSSTEDFRVIVNYSLAF